MQSNRTRKDPRVYESHIKHSRGAEQTEVSQGIRAAYVESYILNSVTRNDGKRVDQTRSDEDSIDEGVCEVDSDA